MTNNVDSPLTIAGYELPKSLFWTNMLEPFQSSFK